MLPLQGFMLAIVTFNLLIMAFSILDFGTIPNASGEQGLYPDYPHHVAQRGHNKQVVLPEEADFRYSLSTLERCKDINGVKVYGFCVMTDFTST
jgi:hypothetical protein